MANLTYSEKKKLEVFLMMNSGFVLDFSTYDFKEFVQGSIGIDISSKKYELGSGSKANRLRKLWEVEPNIIVGRLLLDLAKYWEEFCRDSNSDSHLEYYKNCVEISKRLIQNFDEQIIAIKPQDGDIDSEKLVRSIMEGVRKNEPETEIDRLHTYLGKYVRALCQKHGIIYDNSKPLNSIFGSYVKFIRTSGYVESEMSLTILTMSISVIEKFNDVRNNKSFAHPNVLLNYDESKLIFIYLSGIIEFINAIEKNIAISKETVHLSKV